MNPPPPDARASRDAELTALNDVAEAAGTAAGLDAFLRVACDRVLSAVGAELVAFFSVETQVARGDAVLLHACRGDGLSSEELALARERLARVPAETVLPPHGLRERVCEDIAHFPGEAAAALRPFIQTVASVPVLFRAEPVGALLVGHRGGRSRSDCAVELLRALAVHFAAAIEKYRLLQDLRARVEELSLLDEVGRSVASSLELEPTLTEGARALNRLISGSTCYVLLREGSDLRYVASTPPTAMLLGLRISVDGPTLSAYVVREKRAVAVDDVSTDPLVDRDLARTYDARSLLAAPLIVRDESVGAVVVARQGTPRAFTAADIDRITAVANHLAVAIENARLYEHLRESYAELARTQDALVHRERLAALGELAAVVAHEVRNPLGVIFNSLGALRRSVPAVGEARMLLDMVGEEADRLNRIVGELLDFAKPSVPELRPERLERVVEDALSAALLDAGGKVEVRREIVPDLPPVPVDVRLLRRAFVNLVVNALQAMPEGGVLTIAIHRTDQHAIVEIGDTGPGIAEPARDRLFEPFFTTKATGTGLGLTLVKRVVDDHGGTIAVRSGSPRGAVFSVQLPLEGDPGALRDRIRRRIEGGRPR